jgi:hypothetical protein
MSSPLTHDMEMSAAALHYPKPADIIMKGYTPIEPGDHSQGFIATGQVPDGTWYTSTIYGSWHEQPEPTLLITDYTKVCHCIMHRNHLIDDVPRECLDTDMVFRDEQDKHVLSIAEHLERGRNKVLLQLRETVIYRLLDLREGKDTSRWKELEHIDLLPISLQASMQGKAQSEQALQGALQALNSMGLHPLAEAGRWEMRHCSNQKKFYDGHCPKCGLQVVGIDIYQGSHMRVTYNDGDPRWKTGCEGWQRWQIRTESKPVNPPPICRACVAYPL